MYLIGVLKYVYNLRTGTPTISKKAYINKGSYFYLKTKHFTIIIRKIKSYDKFCSCETEQVVQNFPYYRCKKGCVIATQPFIVNYLSNLVLQNILNTAKRTQYATCFVRQVNSLVVLSRSHFFQRFKVTHCD